MNHIAHDDNVPMFNEPETQKRMTLAEATRRIRLHARADGFGCGLAADSPSIYEVRMGYFDGRRRNQYNGVLRFTVVHGRLHVGMTIRESGGGAVHELKMVDGPSFRTTLARHADTLRLTMGGVRRVAEFLDQLPL